MSQPINIPFTVAYLWNLQLRELIHAQLRPFIGQVIDSQQMYENVHRAVLDAVELAAPPRQANVSVSVAAGVSPDRLVATIVLPFDGDMELFLEL